YGMGPQQPHEVARVLDAQWRAAPSDSALIELRFEPVAVDSQTPADADQLRPVVSATHGVVRDVQLQLSPEGSRVGKFRFNPDAHDTRDDSITAYLTSGKNKVSETWSYRWTPKS